jgi:hypothetical protein
MEGALQWYSENSKTQNTSGAGTYFMAVQARFLCLNYLL